VATAFSWSNHSKYLLQQSRKTLRFFSDFYCPSGAAYLACPALNAIVGPCDLCFLSSLVKNADRANFNAFEVPGTFFFVNPRSFRQKGSPLLNKSPKGF
jgi:hypothetical protein